MSHAETSTTRRQFVTAAAAALALGGRIAHAAPTPRNRICLFTKPIDDLPHEQLAETVAAMGFDGIEATIRPGGQIPPQRVEDDLPRLVEALKRHGLEITVMATDISRADQPHAETTLRTAAALGVKRYRMSGYHYDLNKPVLEQLDELRPIVAELAAMNRQIGICGVYQNHAGPRNVGALLWDLQQLLADHPVWELGVAFDIRHAMVEGGTAWPIHFNLMRPHFGMVYVKDFHWTGGKVVNVPMGTGQIGEKFYQMLRASNYGGPISLHVPYLNRQPLAEKIAAITADLKVLGGYLR